MRTHCPTVSAPAESPSPDSLRDCRDSATPSGRTRLSGIDPALRPPGLKTRLLSPTQGSQSPCLSRSAQHWEVVADGPVFGWSLQLWRADRSQRSAGPIRVPAPVPSRYHTGRTGGRRRRQFGAERGAGHWGPGHRQPGTSVHGCRTAQPQPNDPQSSGATIAGAA